MSICCEPMVARVECAVLEARPGRGRERGSARDRHNPRHRGSVGRQRTDVYLRRWRAIRGLGPAGSRAHVLDPLDQSSAVALAPAVATTIGSFAGYPGQPGHLKHREVAQPARGTEVASRSGRQVTPLRRDPRPHPPLRPRAQPGRACGGQREPRHRPARDRRPRRRERLRQVHPRQDHAGLHDKTAGEVVYKGETLPKRYAPGDFQRFARSMQMIFQDPYSSLNRRMTVARSSARGCASTATSPAARFANAWPNGSNASASTPDTCHATRTSSPADSANASASRAL